MTRRQGLRFALLSWLACEGRLLAESTLPRLSHVAGEDSGYLRRLAESEIEWRPWSLEVLEEAAQLNRPLFVTMGYFSCHWCRKLDGGALQEAAIAKLLNTSFIPVRVDRFERPELDRLYMRYQELMTKRGGWPLNVWMTPEGLPIRSVSLNTRGKEVERLMMSGEHTARWWQAETASTRQQAQERFSAFRRQIEPQPASAMFEITRDFGVRGFGQIAAELDPVNGGFGRLPKFMAPARLELLALSAAGSQKNGLRAEEARNIIITTLRGMARGGLRDHLEGGFFRYAFDAAWKRPYFEKMALDQALTVRSFVTGWLLTRDEEFATVARETLAYADRELGHPEGAFYNAEACDSLPSPDAPREIEGAAYTWTIEQVRQVAGEQAPLLESVFGLRERGNLPPGSLIDGGTGQENLLIPERTPVEAARALGLSAAEAQSRFTAGCAALRAARRCRPRPARDPLLITQMNAALATAFIRAGMALSDAALIERGARALRFVRQQLWDEAGETLYRCRTVKGPRHLACAEDYAATVDAALNLYEATGAHEWLIWADEVQRVFDRLYEDPERGGYFDAASTAKDVPLRIKTYDDASQISPNAQAGLNLVRWMALLADKTREEKARRLLTAFHQLLSAHPGVAAGLTWVAESFLRRPSRMVLIGPRDSAGAAEVRKRVWTHELTRPVLIHLSDPGSREWWAAREALPVPVLNYEAEREPAIFIIPPSGEVKGPFPVSRAEAHWPEPW